jgi:hypothetical protein
MFSTCISDITASCGNVHTILLHRAADSESRPRLRIFTSPPWSLRLSDVMTGAWLRWLEIFRRDSTLHSA